MYRPVFIIHHLVSAYSCQTLPFLKECFLSSARKFFFGSFLNSCALPKRDHQRWVCRLKDSPAQIARVKSEFFSFASQTGLFEIWSTKHCQLNLSLDPNSQNRTARKNVQMKLISRKTVTLQEKDLIKPSEAITNWWVESCSRKWHKRKYQWNEMN